MLASRPNDSNEADDIPPAKRTRTERPTLSSCYRPRPESEHIQTRGRQQVSLSTSPVLTSASSSSSSGSVTEHIVTPMTTVSSGVSTEGSSDKSRRHQQPPQVHITSASLPARPTFTPRSVSNKARPLHQHQRSIPTKPNLVPSPSLSASAGLPTSPAQQQSEALSREGLSRRADETIARLTGTPTPTPESNAISKKVDEVIKRFEREAQQQTQVVEPAELEEPVLLPRPKKKVTLKANPLNQIYIGNLPLSTQLAGLRKAFEKVSPVLTIELRAPFAMIESERDGMAEEAVEEYDRGTFGGVQIRVERAPVP